MSEEVKIEIENILNCYVCLEETNNISPCECKANICDICFKKILKNNGKKCTICKKEYENIEELIEDDLENIENIIIIRRNINSVENIKFLLCSIILILLTPLFGLFFRILIGFEKINYFSIYSFLFGLIIWFMIILVANFLIAFIKLAYCIVEEINNFILRINS